MSPLAFLYTDFNRQCEVNFAQERIFSSSGDQGDCLAETNFFSGADVGIDVYRTGCFCR